MNCAPIVLQAGDGTSKRSTSQHVKRDDLPDMFVANIAGVTTCTVGPDKNVLYPNPGPNPIRIGSDGDGCDKSIFVYPSDSSSCPRAVDQYSWCTSGQPQYSPERIHTSLFSHSATCPATSMPLSSITTTAVSHSTAPPAISTALGSVATTEVSHSTASPASSPAVGSIATTAVYFSTSKTAVPSASCRSSNTSATVAVSVEISPVASCLPRSSNSSG